MASTANRWTARNVRDLDVDRGFCLVSVQIHVWRALNGVNVFVVGSSP